MLRTFLHVYAAALVGCACVVARAEGARIVVHVPRGTPHDAEVYVAGSLEKVGGWRADGVKLRRLENGTYAGWLQLQPGEKLEFKITRGSWETVEKKADGSERPNRTFTADDAGGEIVAVVERWASAGPSRPQQSTIVGDLTLHQLESKSLQAARTIRVWLPPGYDAHPAARFGVLYMHDGQNCFDRATSAFGNEWQIDETLTTLISEKRIPPIIVVGVDNGLARRIDEYTYTADPRRGGGAGEAYAKFLLEEVKPFVDATFRTRTEPGHTWIGGSSLGGVISLEIVRRHPNTFGGVIAMSPAIWWAGESLTAAVEQDPGGLAGTRVWIDMGTREKIPAPNENNEEQSARFLKAIRRLEAAFAKHGTTHRLMLDDRHAEHNEPAWAARFPQAITYLLDAAK